MLKSLSLLTLLTLFLSVAYASENELCVLAFEKRINPIAQATQRVFKNSQKTRVVLDATPKDLRDCLKDNFEEIVLIIHAMDMDETRVHVNLGYFREFKGLERDNYIELNLSKINSEIEVLQSDARTNSRAIKKLEQSHSNLENLSPTYPLYSQPQIIFNRFFETIEKEIIEKKNAGDLKLKKVRLMSCAKELIYGRYPFFSNLESHGIEFEAAPASRLWSRVKGKSVTQFSAKWLRSSVR